MKKILFGCSLLLAALSNAGADVETIVCLRHGEKSPEEIGQLRAKGLNRALALPDVLSAHFGIPQFLFAPDPARNQISKGKKGPLYDYVRPLATIEPTAIRFGLPVNAHYGYKDIAGLETEVLKPQYRNAVVVIAWEHRWEAKFMAKLVSDLGGDPTAVPLWEEADYDSLYVARIERTADHASISFRREHEDLNGVSEDFPKPAPGIAAAPAPVH